jgi:hypothetical protein
LQIFFFFYLQGVSKQQDTCYQHTFHFLKCPTISFILSSWVSHEKTKKPQHRSLPLVKPKAVGFTSIRAHPRLSCTAEGEAHGPTLDSGCLQTLIIQEWHQRKEVGTIILPGHVNTEMLLEKKRPAAEKEPDLLHLHQCGAIRRWPGTWLARCPRQTKMPARRILVGN